MKAKKVLAVAVVAACSLVAGTAMADVLECQQKNGYANGKVGDPSAPTALEPALVNTWATVRANSVYFSGRRLTSQCVAKEVESPKSTAKKAGAPDVGTYPVPGTDVAPYITQDECSMLNSIAQIHSKLGNAKVGDAYLVNLALIDKANSLSGTKLDSTSAKSIADAAKLVDVCILPMLP